MSDQREMTLDEYLESKLPDFHLARRQLQELREERDALAAARDEYEQCGYQWNIRATDEEMPEAIPLEVFADAKNLSIRIGIETLCHAVSFGRPYGQGDIKITDRDLFIKGLLLELKSELEDGTTPVHSMFDEAVNQMLENGEEGLDFEEPTE